MHSESSFRKNAQEVTICRHDVILLFIFGVVLLHLSSLHSCLTFMSTSRLFGQKSRNWKHFCLNLFKIWGLRQVRNFEFNIVTCLLGVVAKDYNTVFTLFELFWDKQQGMGVVGEINLPPFPNHTYYTTVYALTIRCN